MYVNSTGFTRSHWRHYNLFHKILFSIIVYHRLHCLVHRDTLA
ncbi:unnamed protein product [Tenebrio molitor]|nr:unnamed protein product [Tenebrio molitor]